LNRNSINWGNKAAIVRGKGDKEREVYFNIRCNIWLNNYLNQLRHSYATHLRKSDPSQWEKIKM
jgi:site-specific recombinase XerD